MKLKPEILSNYCVNSQFNSAHCDGSQTVRSPRLPDGQGSLISVLYKLLFTCNLLLSVTIVNAQQIKATARLDSTNILLGDQLKLFLEIDYPKNATVEFPQIADSLAGKIEVLNKSKIDTIDLADKTFLKQIRYYTITSFDSGSYLIEPQWFKVNINGKIDSVPTNGVTLNVHTMVIDTTRGLTDIKMRSEGPVTLK